MKSSKRHYYRKSKKKIIVDDGLWIIWKILECSTESSLRVQYRLYASQVAMDPNFEGM